MTLRTKWLAVIPLALTTLTGCTTGGLAPENAPGSPLCAEAQKGQRYSVCGRLTTGTLRANSPGKKTAKASLDVVRSPTGHTYQLTGGTVHASH